MKKVGSVMVSYDYDSFVLDEVNRPIDGPNLQRIVDSMRKNFLITVALIKREKDEEKGNDKLIVLDGQHRLKACKALNMPFYFAIINDLDVIETNTNNETLATYQNTKSWQPNDYVHFYTKQGKEEYTHLSEFMDATGLPCIASVIAMTGNIGVSLPSTFKKGRFKVKNIEAAYALANIIQEFKEIGFKSATNPKFVSALLTGLNMHNISIKKMKEGLEVNPNLRFIAGSTRDTLQNMKEYSMKDRQINKQFVEFKNDWSY